MATKQYLYNPITKQKYPVNGMIMSDGPADAIPLNQLITPQDEELPRAVNLTPFMSDVEDQLKTSSCVANSIVGAYEYLMRRTDSDTREMSRLFIYYNARAIDPQKAGIIRDTGCQINHAIEAIKQKGTCTEDRWKFDFDNRNKRPTPDCFNEAESHKAADAVQVPVELTSLKACLARGFPIVIGARLFQSFPRAETNGGWVSQPQPGEKPLQGSERHAMLVVGYDDERQYFIVRNSWGPRWGNKGYCAMPYTYVGDSTLCEVAYTIRKVNNFDLGREHWTDPDKIEYGVPSDLGGSEDEVEEKCEVINADDEEDTAGAGDDSNTQEEQQDGEEQTEEE